MQSSSKIAQITSVLVLALICAISAHAQVTTGNLQGTVTDPNGAAVPNAKVTLTNKATNTSSTTQTTEGGRFTFSGLVPETYMLTVEASNFKTLTMNDIRIQLKDVQDVSAQLEVGGASEQVVVTAGGSELIDTTTTLCPRASARTVSELARLALGQQVLQPCPMTRQTYQQAAWSGYWRIRGGQRPRKKLHVDG